MNHVLTGLLVFTISFSVVSLGCEKKPAAKVEPTKNQGDTNGQTRLPLAAPGPSEKIFGPFALSHKHFTVTYTHGDAVTGNTMKIRDDAGISYLNETFPNSSQSSVNVSNVFKLEGKSGEGFLIFYEVAPNTVACSEGFQLFSMASGSFAALSPPITSCSRAEELPKGSERGVLRLLDNDLIKIQVWNDFFGIRGIPLKVDFQKMKIAPLMAQGVFDIDIPYPIEPIDSIRSDEIIFYADHNDNSKKQIIKTMEIKKTEFINVFAEVQLKNYLKISNIWLKARVNGQDVWVNNIGDFHVLGLRSAD